MRINEGDTGTTGNENDPLNGTLTLSELIAKLQAIHDEHGELLVVGCGEYDGLHPVANLRMWSKQGGRWARTKTNPDAISVP